MVESKDVHSSSPAIALKLQLVTEQLSKGECWIPLEKDMPSNERYYNTYTNDYAYTYADHTCDDFQYWVKDNLQKLGLKF